MLKPLMFERHFSPHLSYTSLYVFIPLFPLNVMFFKTGCISQTLLRYGANPDLRDEDGKTPLDKARERGDEGHREVIQILQSPGMT